MSQTPPMPLIDSSHCANVAKLQLGDVPSLNWAQYWLDAFPCAYGVLVVLITTKTEMIAARITTSMLTLRLS